MSIELLRQAKAFAIDAHKDQRYGDLPYEYHLNSVFDNMPDNSSYVAQAAAWLHDTVEDTEVTLHDIRVKFGGNVARLVDAVTDESGPNRKVRKEGMYRKLTVAPLEARTIKLADRLANMRASAENPKMRSMYLKEFSYFMKKVAVDKENCHLIISLYEVFMNILETQR